MSNSIIKYLLSHADKNIFLVCTDITELRCFRNEIKYKANSYRPHLWTEHSTGGLKCISESRIMFCHWMQKNLEAWIRGYTVDVLLTSFYLNDDQVQQIYRFFAFNTNTRTIRGTFILSDQFQSFYQEYRRKNGMDETTGVIL
jgi:hypothetical protein